MKFRLTAIIFCLLLILSAGCVGLGQNTTDIMVGDTSVGTITLTPQDDGTYSADISVFGMTFTRDALSAGDAETLTEQAASGNIFSMLGLQEVPENAGTPTDADEFLESILNMPLTNSGEGSLAENLNFSLAGENAVASAAALENLISGFFTG